MRTSRTLLSTAVATALGVAAVPALAAGPTLYGDISAALTYTGSAGTGTSSSYALNDNVSIFGFKGDATGSDKSTKYFYDFNWILDGGSPGTHLAIIGMEGGMGSFTVGLRDNGLFENTANAGIYATNWFYIPGMTSLQVSKSLKFMSKPSGGLQFGVQAFDIANGGSAGDKSTTNYTVGGTYAMGDLSFGAAYTSYSKYGNGLNEGSASSDTNQFGIAQNTFSGVVIKSMAGVNVGYKSGKFGIVGAYTMRKPTDMVYSDPTIVIGGGGVLTYVDGSTSAQLDNTIKTLMVTGTYAYSDKTNLVANFSNTKQTDGIKGTVITLMASYAAESYLSYTLEFQNSNKDANAYGITGTTYAGGDKSSNGIAIGAAYTF